MKPRVKAMNIEVVKTFGGHYVLHGVLLEHHHTHPGLVPDTMFRSSKLLSANFVTKEYETLNTIYYEDYD